MARKKEEKAVEEKGSKKDGAFTKAELETFRKRLMEIREEVLKNVRSRIADKRTIGDHKELSDQQDIAAEETERELQFLLTDRDRRKLIEVDDALDRLEKGTYGICEECGEPIGKERLKILPFTRYTLECQQEMEELNRLERARQLEEDEKQYIEFQMTEQPQPDEADEN